MRTKVSDLLQSGEVHSGFVFFSIVTSPETEENSPALYHLLTTFKDYTVVQGIFLPIKQSEITGIWRFLSNNV